MAVLAAPHAITELLSALMDGRREQLPASEDRWEHGAALVRWVGAASALEDDCYEAAYRGAKEEADEFSRWQAQLESAPSDAAAQFASAVENTEVDTARETQSAPGRPDAAELARHTHVNVILDCAR